MNIFDILRRVFPGLFRRRKRPRRAITVTTKVVALDQIPASVQFRNHTPR